MTDQAKVQSAHQLGTYIHTCHAKGCEAIIPPKLLFCLKHWRMVPKGLQARVWATYRPGQEIDKRPSAIYLEVMQQAIDAVAAKEAALAGMEVS